MAKGTPVADRTTITARGPICCGLSMPSTSSRSIIEWRIDRIVAILAPPTSAICIISLLSCSISTTAARGIAKCSPPARTIRPGMMVSVSGTRSVMRSPCPG